MSGLQVERIQAHMARLKLFRTAPLLEALLQEASKKELSYSDFLEELFTSEVASKQEKKTAMLVAMAHFPFQKSLESFDFKFQPSLDPKLVRELSGGRFMGCKGQVC
jgi:DNA replication protein DnaC